MEYETEKIVRTIVEVANEMELEINLKNSKLMRIRAQKSEKRCEVM